MSSNNGDDAEFRPDLFCESGRFSVLDGIEYLSMVTDSSDVVVVLVEPGVAPPESGFEADASGWSRKAFRSDQFDRIFRRDTYIVWRQSLWYVPDIDHEKRTFAGQISRGHVLHEELLKDPRVTRGDDRGELWASLSFDDMDAVSVEETEYVVGSGFDDSTRRCVFTWRRNSAVR